MPKDFLFTSESVSEGHPDKICDQISDTLVDAYLAKDPYSRLAIETFATTNRIVIGGETRTPEILKADIENLIRQTVGHSRSHDTGCFECLVVVHIHGLRICIIKTQT